MTTEKIRSPNSRANAAKPWIARRAFLSTDSVGN